MCKVCRGRALQHHLKDESILTSQFTPYIFYNTLRFDCIRHGSPLICTVIHSQGGENKTTEFVLHENEPDEKALWLVQGLVQHLELTTLSTEVESPKTSYIAGGIISALLVCYSIWGYSIAMSMVGRRVPSIIYALLQPAVYLGPTGTAILGVILTALCIWFFIIRRSRKQYVSTTYGKGSKETV